jgi:hypothetical protein
VLIGFVDEVRGTMARLSAYGMALALLAILGLALCNALPVAMVAAPSTMGGWSQVERPVRAFAVGQANLHDKTEVYETFRHPEGGRKDTLRWIAADGTAVAELEIYRPGGEFREKGLLPAGPFAGMDRGGAPEREAAGLIASKFGPVTLRGPSGSADDGRACLGFIKRINDVPLQISCCRPEMMRSWRTCSPAPSSGAAIARPAPHRRIGSRLPKTPGSAAGFSAGIWGQPTKLWHHPAKALVFMKLSRAALHYSGAVWRN